MKFEVAQYLGHFLHENTTYRPKMFTINSSSEKSLIYITLYTFNTLLRNVFINALLRFVLTLAQSLETTDLASRLFNVFC